MVEGLGGPAWIGLTSGGGGGGSCTHGLGGGQGGAKSSDGLISGGQVIMAAREVPSEAHPLARVVHLFICDMFC